MRKISEQGNILFLILIAVALFAALSYAVTQSTRGGGDTGAEQVRMQAAQIVNYTSAIHVAIARMKLITGCGELEISFENSLISGYVNANAPIDKSCHVFHKNGGGVSILEYVPGTNYSFFYTGNMYVSGVGTGSPELTVSFWTGNDDLAVEKMLCEEINKNIGFDSGVAEVTGNFGAMTLYQFRGEPSPSWRGYRTSSAGVYGNSDILGKEHGCVVDDNGSRYVYYNVLITR
jgi:hypothetical protein